MSHSEIAFLDVERLIKDTQFEIILPARGEKIIQRKVYKDEPAFLAIRGTVEEYEGQHAFSARLLVLCSVTPRLTFEAALSLGSDAVVAAAELLRLSGFVPDEPPAEPTADAS